MEQMDFKLLKLPTMPSCCANWHLGLGFAFGFGVRLPILALASCMNYYLGWLFLSGVELGGAAEEQLLQKHF